VEKYKWYTVELDIERPKPKKTILLKTVQREMLSFQIELQNPLNSLITFKIEYEGKYLFGSQEITL